MILTRIASASVVKLWILLPPINFSKCVHVAKFAALLEHSNDDTGVSNMIYPYCNPDPAMSATGINPTKSAIHL